MLSTASRKRCGRGTKDTLPSLVARFKTHALTPRRYTNPRQFIQGCRVLAISKRDCTPIQGPLKLLSPLLHSFSAALSFNSRASHCGRISGIDYERATLPIRPCRGDGG
ncbi:hypothetical protein PISMIDRAFT_239142 [Pisolithus microcarpus 441]|uniref:Uncharacterized protein n=1 Tax=Pisolithus microcarpus 441 TaxID=765257 RepID=A0A0C9XWQ2_9AGAM|nr:hypothetical protein PISMIDRAFT_239142 [Pisolithus microcarpus 441]